MTEYARFCGYQFPQRSPVNQFDCTLRGCVVCRKTKETAKSCPDLEKIEPDEEVDDRVVM